MIDLEDLRREFCLDDHVIRGTPVVPFAVVMELMARFVGNPNLLFENIRCLKGISISNSKRERGVWGGEGTVAPPRIKWRREPSLPSKKKAIYESAALFHGPHYQMLEDIRLSTDGATASIRTPQHSTFLNPYAIDAGIQAAVFWMWKQTQLASLPMAVKHYVAFTNPLPTELFVQVKGFVGKNKCFCDLSFYSMNKEPLARLEGLELIAYFAKKSATEKKLPFGDLSHETPIL